MRVTVRPKSIDLDLEVGEIVQIPLPCGGAWILPKLHSVLSRDRRDLAINASKTSLWLLG